LRNTALHNEKGNSARKIWKVLENNFSYYLFQTSNECLRSGYSLNVDEQTFELFVDEHLPRTNYCRTILKEIYIILA